MADMDDILKGADSFETSCSLAQFISQLLDDLDVAGQLHGRDRVGLRRFADSKTVDCEGRVPRLVYCLHVTIVGRCIREIPGHHRVNKSPREQRRLEIPISFIKTCPRKMP